VYVSLAFTIIFLRGCFCEMEKAKIKNKQNKQIHKKKFERDVHIIVVK